MTGEGSADAPLVERARKGDQAAYSAFIRRHQEGLYRFIRRYVGDAAEAQDLLQETFVTAWEALSRFDLTKPAGPWLRRIALNKCRDWSRRRAVRRFFFGAASLDSPLSNTVADHTKDEADDGLEAQLAQLDREIAAMPPSLKEPLLLTAFEGLSHQEAASLLHLTPKAIENRLYRARKLLAEKLVVSEDAFESDGQTR